MPPTSARRTRVICAKQKFFLEGVGGVIDIDSVIWYSLSLTNQCVDMYWIVIIKHDFELSISFNSNYYLFK